jgi:ABC-type nitrate/sulfonate/bicarbonate transport system substrate-binding protein
MRRVFLVLSSLFLIASGAAEAQTLVRMGVAQSSIGTLPFLAAEERGFFAD